MRLRHWSFILLLLSIASCVQTENSDTLDASTYGGGSGAAQSIFSQHCTPCHSFQSMSTSDLEAAGLMVKGDPANSQIYYRLIGSTGGPGPKDMPQSGGALSASDIATIHDFIQNAP